MVATQPGHRRASPGSPQQAAALLQESRTLAERIGFREGIAWSLEQLGMPPDLTNNTRPAVVTRPATPESRIFSAGSAPARMKPPVGAPRVLVAGRFSCEHRASSTRPVANSGRRRDAGGESGLCRALIRTWLSGVGGVGSEPLAATGLRRVARPGFRRESPHGLGNGGS